MDPSKVQAVREEKTPIKPNEIQSFLGFGQVLSVIHQRILQDSETDDLTIKKECQV